MPAMKKDSGPLISVIIAARNCAHCLPEALNSLFAQQYANFEIIIIDGGSTDGTVDIIRQAEKKISSWVSEPDKGIADAFNKGILRSSGQLLFFMGADDELYDDKVFQDVASGLKSMKEPYFFYGDLYYSYKEKIKLIHQNFTFKKFRHYNCIPHQAMFMDRWFVEKYGYFDTDYTFAMDYEYISRFIDYHKPEYFERVIAKMHRYGMSSNVIATHAEMDKVRLSQGWVTGKRLILDRLILRFKLVVAEKLALDW